MESLNNKNSISTVPPKAAGETHEDYMKNFINLLVETTKHSSVYDGLMEESRTLLSKIVDGCRELMIQAARKQHSTAKLYVYLIGTRGNVTRDYDLLFPKDHLAEQFDKIHTLPVFKQVQNYLQGLKIEHKIYETYKGETLEIRNHTGDLLLIGDILEDSSEEVSEKEGDVEIPGYTPQEKLPPTRLYVGVITASWGEHLVEKSVETTE